MGTSNFAVPILKKMVESDCQIVGVYTQPAKAAGRGKKVQMGALGLYASQQGLPLFCPKNFSSENDMDQLRKLEADLIVVVSYGLILPDEVLNLPGLGCFNIHASLLPRWRGAAPIQRAILAHDKQTGICVIKMTKSLDSGPIVAHQEITIDSRETFGSLHLKLSEIGSNIIVPVIKNLKKSDYLEQSAEGILYARKIEKIETRINWNDKVKNIDAKIRAFSPSPGAWCLVNGERVKILESSYTYGNGKPGFVIDSNFRISAVDGVITPLKVQRSGKSIMRTIEFLRGFNILPGTILE
jgi:methionyl-tRNA formyltransferase